MTRRRFFIAYSVAALISLCFPAPADAGGADRAGIYSSVKGAGAIIYCPSNIDDSFRTVCVYHDYGCGAMLQYLHLYNIGGRELNQCSVNLNAGAGISAGYTSMRLFGKGIGGAAVSLSGRIAWDFRFESNIGIDAGLTLDCGMLMHGKPGSILMSTYTKGLVGALVPDITIYYRFQ